MFNVHGASGYCMRKYTHTHRKLHGIENLIDFGTDKNTEIDSHSEDVLVHV